MAKASRLKILINFFIFVIHQKKTIIMAKSKSFTWKDLKVICNSLNEEQLKMDVHWIGEERGGPVESLEIFEEDMISPSGDGVEPKSSYANDKDFNVEEEEVIFAKGTPILWVD